MIKLLDTFSGVGGFHLALQKSIGEENINCIGFSEIDKFAKQVYEHHFPDVPDLGDITKLNIDGLEDFDLLTGGFPCQDVSIAGKQDLGGGRTVLVEYLLQILEKKQPKYFIFENVKGFMGKKFTGFREGIINRIIMSGYSYKMQVLNTKDFQRPQNRERVFIVGCNNCDKTDWFTFPKPQELVFFLKDILEEEVDDKYYLTEKQINGVLNCKFNVSKGLDDINSYSRTLRAAMGMGGGTVPCIRQLNNPKHSNNRIYGVDGISPTLNTMQGGNRQPFINTERIRKLTPTECERLQGFPDNRTDICSNSQRYKQMGNAVSVPVVEKIFYNLIK